jgi:hypothetical protein
LTPATGARAALVVTLLALAPPGFASDRPSAIETFQRLQQELLADKKRGDWRAFLSAAQHLQALVNGAPTSHLEVARAQLELRRPEQALAETRHFLAMGQTNGILDSPLFQPLRNGLSTSMHSNVLPISLAKPAIQLSDSGLLPEDIDYDPQSRRYYVSSILEHGIVVVDDAGHQQAFAESPDHWPMLALKVDTKRRRLWATEVALQDFSSVAAADWGRSALLEYDLDRGILLARYDGPLHSNLGDMALAANGDPIVADGTGGGIYRLRGGGFQRIDHGDFISPQTIAVCDDSRYVFVPDYVRGIAAFDPETGSVRWLSTKDRYAMDGIDGLYCHGSFLVAVQNGASPERVVAFALNASRSAVVAEKVIERATATLGEPTHGVFVGGTFYYVANSGWDTLDDHGAVRSAAQLTPALIMRVDESALIADPGSD